jgi:DNA polymerase elongation subunit (family B)
VNDFKEKHLEYDPEYYINNQVLPAVGRIFEVLGYSKDSLQGKMQTTLGGFLTNKKINKSKK